MAFFVEIAAAAGAAAACAANGLHGGAPEDVAACAANGPAGAAASGSTKVPVFIRTSVLPHGLHCTGAAAAADEGSAGAGCDAANEASKAAFMTSVGGSPLAERARATGVVHNCGPNCKPITSGTACPVPACAGNGGRVGSVSAAAGIVTFSSSLGVVSTAVGNDGGMGTSCSAVGIVPACAGNDGETGALEEAPAFAVCLTFHRSRGKSRSGQSDLTQ